MKFGRRAVLALLLGASLGASACVPGDESARPVAPPTQPVPGSRPDTVHDPESRDLLDRIVRAERSVAYHGVRTTVYGPEGGSRATRLRIVHTAEGRTFMEWTPARGDATPDRPSRSWSTESRFAWADHPALLLRNYRVVLLPDDPPPVAWRPSRLVRITGRSPGRPSLDLVVDAETWVVLADTWRTPDGASWLRGRFDAIEFGLPPEVPPERPSESIVAGDSVPPADSTVLQVGLPLAGFERVRARTTPCGQWAEEFSDGLAAFSVRQSLAGPSDPVAGEIRRKRWLGGGALSARIGVTAVVVDGALPDDDLQRVLGALGGDPAR